MQEMKALQRACTALSQENGKLEVSDTVVMFGSLPFLIHVASMIVHITCFYLRARGYHIYIE